MERFKKNHPVNSWYLPSRFGMFYHWGLFTGGGFASDEHNTPFKFSSVKDFENAAPSPEELAKNIVATTKKVGAKYIIFTVFHPYDKYFIIYPTKMKWFKNKANKDYLGALLEEAHNNDLKFIAYFSSMTTHYYNKSGEYLDIPPDWTHENNDEPLWTEICNEFMLELKERYGENSIDGFWLDGFSSWLPMKNNFPNAILTGNNHTNFFLFDIPADICAIEFLATEPEPQYNRPSAAMKPYLDFRDDQLVPRKDYVEDIPTCGNWWDTGDTIQNKYTQSPTFWIKEMICSLGIRRKWNYTMGLGPRLDGTPPPEFEPMLNAMERFMQWASPAIYNTTGGECYPIQAGWLNSNAFGALTVSNENPETSYLLVTDPPNIWDTEVLRVQHDWVEIESVKDLRTGKELEFIMNGSIDIINIDWSDIEEYGAKVFVFKLKPGSLD
jgi:hypothetical protein